MEESAYESLAAREQTHWFCTTRREVIAQTLTAEPTARGRVLEIGSGTGGNVDMLRGFGHLTCVEMSATARELTRQRFGEDLDLRAGAWPDESPIEPDERFDVVALLDVLEHLPLPEASLKKIAAHLRPDDGRLIVTVPAYQWMWSAHDRALHHLRRYTRASLNAALREAGLEVLRVSYFNTILFPAAAAARGLFRLLRIDRSPGQGTPSPAVNGLARWAFRRELPLLRRTSLPFGLSVMAVARVRSRP